MAAEGLEARDGLLRLPAATPAWGLAIREQIAHGHDGEIAVENTVGQGTRFTVALPLQ